MSREILTDSDVMFDFIKCGMIEKDFKVVYARKHVFMDEEETSTYFKVITVNLQGDTKIYLRGITDDTYTHKYLQF